MIGPCPPSRSPPGRQGELLTDEEFIDFARGHTPALFRTAMVLCRDVHAAEDLVQESLAKVYVAWVDKRRSIDDPAAYARTALVRTYVSGRRRRTSTEVITDSLPELRYLDGDGADRVWLSQALDQLPRRDRVILALRFLDDHSVAEVAEMLTIKPGAVRTRTNRALARIRNLVDLTPEESRS